MKTKVEKFTFLAKIARNIACLTALFALSASADDARTLGYATSGAAAALPAAPDMGGTVVNVTAAQAQYVLDGAYGSIDGKTINFTESVADTLVLGRASKYAGSGTLYRHGSHDGEAMSYEDFIAYKNQATWTEGCYYERTVENVTFTADKDVIVNFTTEGGAHVYGTESAPVYDYVRDTGTWIRDTNNSFYKRAILKNITFQSLTFKEKTNFETSESTTVFDGFTFTGCTFEIGSTAAGNYALRYYDEYNNGNVRNLVVENCTFRNCYQGVYTHHVKGITVKDSAFETTGHNAIAIQSQGGEKGACDHGAVVITGNTFKNIGDRIIRFNEVGAGTTITIADNTADGNSGKKVSTDKREIVKAESLPANAAEIITASNNDWGANAVAEGVFADAKPVAATIGAVSYETLDAALSAVQDGETVVVNAGEYKLTGSQSAYSGKAFTVKAAEGATVSFDMSAAVTLGGAKITFEGVTFDYKTNDNYIGLQHADTLVYNDCTINGKVFLYATSETFNRCTFNQSAVDYNVWTYGAQKVAFNACAFNCAGKSVLVYNEGATAKTDLTVASCEFNASAEAAGKAAIEIDTSLMKGGASVAIDGETTATGFATGSNSGSALWNDKKQTKDTNKNVTVTVAGETVFAPVVATVGETGYASLAEALAAAKDGDTVKMLADVTVADATTVNGKAVTLDLAGKTLTRSTTASSASTLEVAADAALTVVDSVGDGCVKATGNYSNGIENKGCLIVEAGHFEAVYGAIRALGGSTTTINGGTFASSSERYGLYYWANGTALSVTVNNGVFTHTVSTAMESGKVSLSVKGGSFANDLTAFCTDKNYGTFLDEVTNLYVYDRKSAHKPSTYVEDANGNVTIADGAALIWFARQVNEEGNTFAGKTVKLLADVALTEEWTPVGVSVDKPFRGVFDGGGHVISGMKVAGSYQGYGFGFFKTIAGATVKSVTFANAEVKGAFSNIVGLVVGYSYGSSVFEDVHVTGSTVYAFGKVGGLVGYAEDRSATTIFRGCSVSATTIHGGYNVAGFCGLVQGRCEVRSSFLKDVETIIDEDAQGFGKVVELDTTVVCDGSVATCAGKGTVVKGKYIPNGGYYWSAWSDLYNHYGDSSHDCTLADGKLLANSEVVHDMPVAIGEVKYSDLQAAFDAVKKGDMVTLLADITLTEQVNITKALDGLTLDGNNKTITCATTTDPLQSGGSALYFGNADSKLYCTGIAIKDLTMTGTARFAISLCGGTSTMFTNVKISGKYYYAVNLYGTHGATMTDCNISNSMTGETAAIWSNVASANPLTLNNTTVNVIAINAYTERNTLEPKIYVNAGSTVGEIHTYDDGFVSGDTRLCVGASPVMPSSVKVYDTTTMTWIDALDVVFVDALIGGGRVTLPASLLAKVPDATAKTRFDRFSKLKEPDANGNLAWVNLVAGIDPAKKVTMTAPQNNEPDVIDVDLSAVGEAPEGTDVTVRYEIRADGSEAAVVSAEEAEDLVINLNGKAGIGTYRAYVCLLQNGTEVARVASENALGVLQTVRAAKKTIIAVPWLSLTDGNAIAVADLVKTAGLTTGDKLHVYNKAENRYDVYELTADKAWVPKAIYKVGADGTVETASSGTPETTTVARGSGVWIERQDTTQPIVSYGAVSSATVETTIDAGTAEKPAWNLLAVPTTTAIDIAATFGADAADEIIVPTDGAPKVCTVKDGAWGYDKSVPKTDESGVRVVRETVTELSAGTGFWYLNGGAVKTVNW